MTGNASPEDSCVATATSKLTTEEDMASLLNVKSQAEEFQGEYFSRNSRAEESRRTENRAATRIQSWFRTCKVQAYLSHLHKKAIIIQKTWRGFTARARFRQMVKIQRRWRGFFVRKYVHNFYARKRYLEGLSIKNELVRRELDELEALQKRERDCLDVIKEQTGKVYETHRLHHLLSTKQCPGVFNSPFRPVPHETELLLRQVKYQVPTRPATRGRACLSGTSDSTAPSFPGSLGSPWIKTTTTSSSRPILPPIASKKQQGLFRQPGEVWEQCVQCPDLTLRLQTSYTHLEEAQNKLQRYKSTRLHGGTLGKGNMSQSLSHSSNSFRHPPSTKSFR
ncbi:spermatogenesis-associated protein 17 isoform X2 [Scophthalmus maximus]|uniref:spermatogenesis-associated protein 17 isoform X2 n=1 Tax=Scophthalmus maximus TaxID=52904 RepID=UPI0015E1179F|nr:spermatogenesis-associated protein 17 isoform X2 [Scophthalmus maximus]